MLVTVGSPASRSPKRSAEVMESRASCKGKASRAGKSSAGRSLARKSSKATFLESVEVAEVAGLTTKF